MVAPTNAADDACWRFACRLPWPEVRGRRLYEKLTSRATSEFEIESCEPTAGHIALVLRRRVDETQPPPAPAMDDTNASTASQLALTRVVFVVDAVPPPAQRPTSSSFLAASAAKEPAWTMLTTRSHSFAGSTSTSSTATATTEASNQPISFNSLDVDEVDLVQELFTTTRVGKDACILAKSPLLCARFDARVVAVCFTRSNASASSSSTDDSSSSSTSPLRCVIAREDGMAYIWEWGADLYQWTFLNRFCFLENANLKWTRPILHFTAVNCAWGHTSASHESHLSSVDTTELVWWSSENKQEPKLWTRRIQYGIETNTFRTQMQIGSALEMRNVRDVTTLKSSRLGLWVVSKTNGVSFRSVNLLHTMTYEWAEGFDADDVLTCVHNVTGELLVLDRQSPPRLVLLSPVRSASSTLHPRQLTAKTMTLATETKMSRIESIAAHRQLFLALTSNGECNVFSLLTGQPLTQLPLPRSGGDAAFRMWIMSGRASAVGVWSKQGFWQLQTPTAHALAKKLSQPKASEVSRMKENPALEAVRPYGASLRFEATRFALDLLQSAKTLVAERSDCEVAWHTAVQSISSPALLLATLSPEENAPEEMLEALATLVDQLYHVTHDVLVTGRFSASIDKRNPTTLDVMQHVTPANLEALHHLANWVLLAKRKLARLQTTVYHKGRRHLRARTVSSLSTLRAEDEENQDENGAMPMFNPLEEPIVPKDEATSSALSRKVRPMSSLQFAAGSCSVRHGKQWLAQLESLLLDGVALGSKEGQSRRSGVPHTLLFHEERWLADFQRAFSSFSKHMYFESMSRLYLLHRPDVLLAFVRCIAAYSPRLFSLSGWDSVVRTHAERALALLPPTHVFVHRVQEEHSTLARRSSSTPSAKRRHQRRQRDLALGLASARDALLAYADVLCLCGFYLEAARALLDADLYDECIDRFLTQPLPSRLASTASSSSQVVPSSNTTESVLSAVYFMLLTHCVHHRDAPALTRLLSLRPSHVSVLLALKALKQLLPQQIVRDDTNNSQRITVGALRPVLMAMLKEQRVVAAAS
ncbi:hypothetical protein Poli38472_008990 [Pythium oligandrum]|uniref:Uncharacterized protein n=1 Tax=Pythium oligandrum TaxID=41045 RepID=A0A8K1CM29_PYTOL|nr:hypothetical protein Poli38472_008990 [Pythium oligandrum]|eukprot:TMW64823.1 hypothetical protein Poli38472_008990 [Pythium oligandrum]